MSKKTAISAHSETGLKPPAFAKSVLNLAQSQAAANGVSYGVSQEVIRLRAYQKWEAAGRPRGDGVLFWLEAERELLRTK